MANPKICAVPGCGRGGRLVRGLCDPHYKRLLRHGTPTGGNPTPLPKGTALKFFEREVIAYSGDDCLIWPFIRNSKGYGTIYFEGHNRVVSRLCCLRVHGEPPAKNYQAAHSCGNGHLGCVNPKHLRWATVKENHSDRAGHGTNLAGESGGMAKLKEAQVKYLRAQKGKIPQKVLASRFGVTQSLVSKIQTGAAWKYLNNQNDSS